MLASEEDWSTEYLAPIVSVKSVAGIDEAIAHIEKYGTGHTESIISENKDAQLHFTHSIDSAIVMKVSLLPLKNTGRLGKVEFGKDRKLPTPSLIATCAP